jgi:Domain of unknown function (DUF1848)
LLKNTSQLVFDDKFLLQKPKEPLNMKRFSVISCSRRTDIPAKNMNWIVNQIKQGYVEVKNPFNPLQIANISLKPKDVQCWIWWSKNFKFWIEYFDENEDIFKQYKGHYFQFTINCQSEVEKGISTSLDDRINQTADILHRLGKQGRIMWRFDPLIVWKDIKTKTIFQNWKLNTFENICKKLSNVGLKDLTISFATGYEKVVKRMLNRGKEFIIIPQKEKITIIKDIVRIAENYSFNPTYCCGELDFIKNANIKPSKCIDGKKINKYFGINANLQKDSGQRKNCLCTLSKDIGGYSGKFVCPINCDYCYASIKKY